MKHHTRNALTVFTWSRRIRRYYTHRIVYETKARTQQTKKGGKRSFLFVFDRLFVLCTRIHCDIVSERNSRWTVHNLLFRINIGGCVCGAACRFCYTTNELAEPIKNYLFIKYRLIYYHFSYSYYWLVSIKFQFICNYNIYIVPRCLIL